MSESGAGRKRTLVLRLAAEFVVIVIGVLVALGVDAWSEERAAKVREVELLESLATDLRGSLATLEADNAFTLARVATLEWFLHFPVEGGSPFPGDSIASLGRAANWTSAYYPTLRTFETMIATGTFDLISNAEVRLALTDIRFQTQLYTDYRTQATQQWNDTYSVTWHEFMGVPRLPDTGPASMPDPPPVTSVLEALLDDFFRAVIDRRRIFLWFVADNGAILVETMREALALIEAELALQGASKAP